MPTIPIRLGSSGVAAEPRAPVQYATANPSAITTTPIPAKNVTFHGDVVRTSGVCVLGVCGAGVPLCGMCTGSHEQLPRARATCGYSKSYYSWTFDSVSNAELSS